MKSKHLLPNGVAKLEEAIPPEIKDGDSLYIDEIFYSIQTEGPFHGYPAVFIRVWGCYLDCAFCDTPQIGERPEPMKVKKIVKKVKKLNNSFLVVITGGEPFLYNMGRLVNALIAENFKIQFETSGVLEPLGIKLPMEGVSIVCSPKTPNIKKSIEDVAVAFKYTVNTENTDPKDRLPKGIFRPIGRENSGIMVSPMWTDNKKETKANIEYAVEICKTFGYWLNLQFHKLINIR